MQALAQLARSSYPAETKVRMAAFVEELAAQTLSFEEAAHLSSEAHLYFRMLVALHLRDPLGSIALADALVEEAVTLVFEINNLFEQPAAVRFRAVEHLAARELYLCSPLQRRRCLPAPIVVSLIACSPGCGRKA